MTIVSKKGQTNKVVIVQTFDGEEESNEKNSRTSRTITSLLPSIQHFQSHPSIAQFSKKLDRDNGVAPVPPCIKSPCATSSVLRVCEYVCRQTLPSLRASAQGWGEGVDPTPKMPTVPRAPHPDPSPLPTPRQPSPTARCSDYGRGGSWAIFKRGK